VVVSLVADKLRRQEVYFVIGDHKTTCEASGPDHHHLIDNRMGTHARSLKLHIKVIMENTHAFDGIARVLSPLQMFVLWLKSEGLWSR